MFKRLVRVTDERGQTVNQLVVDAAGSMILGDENFYEHRQKRAEDVWGRPTVEEREFIL